MPDDIKLPPPPPIHHRWAPLISESLAEALQVWCRTYARSAVLVDRQQRAGDAKAWRDLCWSVAKELECLPSSFVDGNEHVLRAARQARAALLGAHEGSRVGTNSGHGHVWARPDGHLARCGGPRICHGCALDLARTQPSKNGGEDA